jgi:hypothetical protein
MRAASITAFIAGFMAGGIALGAIVAHARMNVLNGSAGGVTPGSGASLFCVTSTNAVRAVTGTMRLVSVGAPGGGSSGGVELRCP